MTGPDPRQSSADAVAQGTYAKKQLGSTSALIRWSHRRRFALGLELCRPFVGRRVLDYGAGDGTLLALLREQPFAPALAVGAEIAPHLVDDCTRRLGAPGLRFVHVDDLARPEHAGAYDAVLCLEVLEHVVDVGAVLDRLVMLLAPGATLIVSVPVETGLPVLIKQTVRTLAGWARIGDYPGVTPYTWPQLLRAVVAGERQHMSRPVHDGAHGPYHDHTGFNWRLVRRAIARRVTLIRTLGSPVGWLSPALNSQAWFVGTRH